MFHSVDIAQSGYIDYSEFVIAAMNEKQLLTNEKLQSAFKMFDKVHLSYNCILGWKWIDFSKGNKRSSWIWKNLK